MDRLQRLAENINSVFSMCFKRHNSHLYISRCPFDQGLNTDKHLVKMIASGDGEFSVLCHFCGNNSFYSNMNKYIVIFDVLEYECNYCLTSMDQLNIDYSCDNIVIVLSPTGSNKASIVIKAIKNNANSKRFIIMVRCAYDMWQYRNLFRRDKISYSCYLQHQPFRKDFKSIIMEYKIATRLGHSDSYDRNIYHEDTTTLFDGAYVFIDEFDEILQKKHDIPLNTLYYKNEVVSVETEKMYKKSWENIVCHDSVLVSKINGQPYFNNYLHSFCRIKPNILLSCNKVIVVNNLRVHLLKEDIRLPYDNMKDLSNLSSVHRWFWHIQKYSFMPYIVEFLPLDGEFHSDGASHKCHKRYVSYDVYTIMTILERCKKLVLYSATVTKEILKLIRYVAKLTGKKITIININTKFNRPKVVNIVHTKNEIISYANNSSIAIKALKSLNECILIFKRTNFVAKKVCQTYQAYNLQLYTDDVYNGFSELKTPYVLRMKLKTRSNIVIASVSSHITRGRTIEGVFITIIDTRIPIPLYLNIGPSANATYRNQIEKQINTVVQILGRDKQQNKQVILLENYSLKNSGYLLEHIVHRLKLKGILHINITNLDTVNKKFADYVLSL